MEYKELIRNLEVAIANNKKTLETLDAIIVGDITNPFLGFIRDIARQMEYCMEHELHALQCTNPDSPIKRDMKGLIIEVGDFVLYGDLEYKVFSVIPEIKLIDMDGRVVDFEFNPSDLEII